MENADNSGIVGRASICELQVLEETVPGLKRVREHYSRKQQGQGAP